MIRSDDQSLPPMKWNAWGDPAAAKPLPDGIRTLLVQALGVETTPGSDPEADQVRLRPSALSAEDRDGLVAIVGDAHCISDDYGRLLRAGGKSTLDLLRRKDSGEQDAPDAVLLPADEDEIAKILKHCAQHGIAVVPFGGGTSVVGRGDPAGGGASPRPVGPSRPSCPLICAASTSCTASTRSLEKPISVPESRV